jgi:hypothetical protein
MLRFIQAGPRLYSIARELKCFNERTYHFAISGLGVSFEGHMSCPFDIMLAAMKHVERVKIIMEIDLDQLGNLDYLDTFMTACCEVSACWQNTNATAKRLERYDIEIHVIDSKFVCGKPFHHPATFHNGILDICQRHLITVNEFIKSSFRLLLRVQNIRVGNV